MIHRAPLPEPEWAQIEFCISPTCDRAGLLHAAHEDRARRTVRDEIKRVGGEHYLLILWAQSLHRSQG